MRAGRLDRKVDFYAKTSVRDDFGASTDTWAYSFSMWAEILYVGGDAILSNEEKFWSGTMFMRIRYNPDVVETMRVLTDSNYYTVNYIERIGRKEGLRLTINKINE